MKKSNYKRILGIVLVVTKVFCIILMIFDVILMISGCSVNKFERPKCVTTDYKGFSLEWGYINNKTKSTTGYVLNDDGYIKMFIQTGNQKKYDTICQITPEQLCNVLKLHRNETLKVPVVNEPGDELTFIKLDKPIIDYKTNAIWNKFNTFVSTGYRNIFDTLMLLVKVPEK